MRYELITEGADLGVEDKTCFERQLSRMSLCDKDIDIGNDLPSKSRCARRRMVMAGAV